MTPGRCSTTTFSVMTPSSPSDLARPVSTFNVLDLEKLFVDSSKSVKHQSVGTLCVSRMYTKCMHPGCTQSVVCIAYVWMFIVVCMAWKCIVCVLCVYVTHHMHTMHCVAEQGL